MIAATPHLAPEIDPCGDVGPGASVGGNSPVLALPATLVCRAMLAALADDRFTAAGARAVAAIIGQANSATGCSWVSYRQLKRDYHLGASQIAAALAHACDYLAEDGRGPRGAVRYRVVYRTTVPVAGTVEAASVPAVGTVESGSAPALGTVGAGSAPALGTMIAPATGTGDAAALPLCPSSAPAVGTILDYTGNTYPPNPPQAGGECVSAAPQGQDTDELKRLLEAIDTAHRNVFGGLELSASDRRKVIRGWNAGDRSWLAKITEASLSGGMAKVREKPGRSFGLGWVKRWLLEREARMATGQQRTATASPSQEAVEAQWRRRFLQLNAAEQAMYIEQARPGDAEGAAMPYVVLLTTAVQIWRRAQEATA